MESAIRLRGVRKTFGPKVAVDGMDLDVPRGGLYGFIGPNGAGKTTTIRMIMSILFPDFGEISVLGHASALEAKDRIGYLPEERGVYKKMRVGSFLRHMATLKGAAGADLGKRVTQWLERVGLGDVEKKRCEELSKGMQQKVQFIASVIHEPELLILDEPFSGLDPVNMRLLRELFLEQHQRGATMIFSTHVMHQAEQLCDHIVMIHEGRKVIDDPLSEIRNRFDPRALVVEPFVQGADVSALSGVEGVESVRPSNGAFEIDLHEGSSPVDAMRRIAASMDLARVELKRPTLEDVFIQVVGESGGEREEVMRAALREGATAATAGEETR